MRFFAILAALFALSASAQPPSDSASILAKMERIVIPCAQFREASAMDVLAFLGEASVAADPEPPGSFGLVRPAPRMLATFETEDGSVPDFPPLSFEGRRLTLLQILDEICGRLGIRFAMGPAGPEFFLPDGRRLIRKEVPAPPPAGADDEWGSFGGPGELAPAQPDGIDWEPLFKAYASNSTPADAEAVLAGMGFACSRRPGAFSALREPASLPSDVRPMDSLQAERRVGDVLWTVRIYVDEDNRLGGMFIHPAP